MAVKPTLIEAYGEKKFNKIQDVVGQLDAEVVVLVDATLADSQQKDMQKKFAALCKTVDKLAALLEG